MRRKLGAADSIGAPYVFYESKLVAKDPYKQHALNHAEKMMISWKRSIVTNLIAILVYFSINAVVQLWLMNDWEARHIAIKSLVMLWTTIGMTVFFLETHTARKYYNNCKQMVKELT